jgi:phosphoribosylglycinamide formyltransferase-1
MKKTKWCRSCRASTRPTLPNTETFAEHSSFFSHLPEKITKVSAIAIFASGTGSNAGKIIEYFQDKPAASVGLLVSSRPDAPVLNIARAHGIPQLTLRRAEFYESEKILDDLRRHDIDFIALAGFLWLIPPYLVRAYQGRMVNIHPALLPKYGGKGMYGMRVHQAVKAANERESGITVHWVNERYDDGDIVFQARCSLGPGDVPEDIARKVQALEHWHYPRVIENLLERQNVDSANNQKI